LLDASAALRSPKITQVIITTSINSLSNSKSSEYQTLKNCQSNVAHHPLQITSALL
jgi:hypothetical protein